ncbi:ECF transporter S component [Enterococcus lemanii]|uniref:ECF transporter S component n=1 Tax=Enterococcus lemanii TaxID=1159752 RepID=A0ABV9MUL0_9ENTE|nr:ECF transporter S component [Enterococcus lemanii]MBM7708516.1 putative membrane protein [Enterococcus lemanii]
MEKNNTIHQITYIAVFAALTVIGTMIKIPMPTGAFAHLGNSVLLLAVLLLGYTRGALAGGLGFAIFDLLNGYAAEAPYFLFESFIVGAFAYGAFLLFRKDPTKIWQIVCIGMVTGVGKIMMTQLKNTVKLFYLGSDWTTAFIAASAKLPATFINVFTTIIIVAFLYFPLKKIFQRYL